MTSAGSRWTYRVEIFTHRIDPNILDALGADGWELVTLAHTSDGRSELVFKRPAPDFRTQVTLDQRAQVTRKRDETG